MSGLLAWASRRRSAVATGVSTVVVVALVTTVAVVSSGYEAQRLDLDDGTAWVANGSRSAVGRVNPDVGELNAAVRSTGTDLAVVQSGQEVLLVDRTDATVGLVDPATATVDETVPLPPEQPEVLLAGDRTVVVSGGTGELWTWPTTDLAAFSAEADADLSLGADLVASASPSGAVTTFSAETGEVSLIADAADASVDSTVDTGLAGGDEHQVTSVGSHWAVLDVTSGELVLDGDPVTLPVDASGGALQQAADDGDAVLLATTEGLLSVPFDGGEARALASGRSGAPARPVVVGSCTWAAWSGGSAWSDCSGARGGVVELDGVPGGAALVLAVNGRQVVLNDPVGGRSWALQAGGRLVDNWADLLDSEREREEQEDDSTDQPPELDPDQKAPVAADDAVGARPGRAGTLSVLLNDFDPNGDPLVVEQVSQPDPATARVDLVNDRQQLLLTLTAEATGTFTVDYSISDGRGGSDTATVTVTVRTDAENSAPEQVRRTSASVTSAGRVTASVLGDWVDPDGDAFYLTSASGPPGTSSKPSGDVVYQDAGAGETDVEVALVVSDGQAEGRGSLSVTVTGEAPLRAESFTVEAYAGRQVTVRPLAYATGGSGPIRLNSVPAKSGSTVTPSYDVGTFRFVSDEVRTHNLEYTVTDGDQTATGVVRVDVLSPPDAATPPVTTPKTMFVETLSSQTLDVVATDSDPAGNVLMISSTAEVPLSSGVRVETLDQRYLRVTLTAPLEGRPVTVPYTVTNGLASAEGTVTVVEIPRRSQTQPPVATDDQVTVRVGDAVDIDVLANDEQPDGDEVTLVPDLVQDVPDDGGLLFTSGTRLRYLAPSTPGNVTAVYEVAGRDGQTDSAQVSIAVREADAATNAAPVPETVTARVVAGETVQVRVPLDGIDPDGDSVTLLGVGTNPAKGNVTSVSADGFAYQAAAYAAGTDEFTYTVVDGLGARASGKVRVGVAARADGTRGPVAVADDVTMRPGGTVTVRVLDNDSDPDGGALRVTSVQAAEDGTTAEVVDDELLAVTPPSAEGTYGLVYTIENPRGGTSSSFVSVTVDADAPPNRPVADDSVLDLGDIAGRESVDVDVLANVFFADGPASSLGLAVEPGWEAAASVTDGRRIRVAIADASQIIPFVVTHPDDPSVQARAFVRVPGYDDALPQLDRQARPVSVVSGDTVRIALADHVLAAGGKSVRLTGSASVQATHANGDDLVVDPTTLAFTSEELYFGTASISFEVTDGTSADDPAGRTATLVLPITVTPRENQPPTFNGTSLELEPGESRTLDLVRLTTYPYPDAVDELRYAVDGASAPGFTAEVTGQRLTVSAATSASAGSSATVPVSVRDSVSPGRGGAVQLTVAASTRPLAQPVPDTATVRRGSSTTVDVLANDQSTNPFPGQPLRVVDIRGLGGAGLPAGVSVSPSADSRTLSVSVAAGAAPGDANLQYRVADVTGDPGRYVWGNVTVSVQDVPAQPAAPVRTGSSLGGQLTLSYAAPQANNSAITRFRLVGVGSGGASYGHDCGRSTVCTLTDLDPEQTYRFSVVATNGVGDSAASAASQPYSADFVPAAPTGVTVTPSRTVPGSLDVRWTAVPRPVRGTAVTGYTVEVSGGVSQATGSTSTTIAGLTPGSTYDVSVYARNRAQVTSERDWSRSGAVRATAFGQPGAVTVAAGSRPDGSVELSWSDAAAAGDGTMTYRVRRLDSAPAAGCTTDGKAIPANGRTAVDPSTDRGNRYYYAVDADNGVFCTTSSTSQVDGLPGRATGAVTVEARGNGRFDLRVSALKVAGDVPADSWQARLGSGAWTPVALGSWLTSLGDATVYGTDVSAEFRACRAGNCSDLVSPSVSARPLQAVPSSLSCVAAGSLTIGTPANANPDDLRYSYAVEYLVGSTWQAGEAGSVPADATRARVTTTVTFSGTTSVGVAEATCTRPASTPVPTPTPTPTPTP